MKWVDIVVIIIVFKKWYVKPYIDNFLFKYIYILIEIQKSLHSNLPNHSQPQKQQFEYFDTFLLSTTAECFG